MITKICKTCKNTKEINMFSKRNRFRKNGERIYESSCLECKREISKLWKLKNKEKVREYNKKYLSKKIEWSRNNRDKIKQWRYNNKDKISKINKKYNSKEHVKLISNIRCRTRIALNNTKNKSTSEYLECDYNFFRKWIEWQFDTNMNWNNYGSYWNLDHVWPCSKYKDYKNTFTWKNIRPYNSLENIKKNNKIIHFQLVMQELKVYHYMQHLQIAGNSLETRDTAG